MGTGWDSVVDTSIKKAISSTLSAVPSWITSDIISHWGFPTEIKQHSHNYKGLNTKKANIRRRGAGKVSPNTDRNS